MKIELKPLSLCLALQRTVASQYAIRTLPLRGGLQRSLPPQHPRFMPDFDAFALSHMGGFRERLEELGLGFAVDIHNPSNVRFVGAKGRLGKVTSVKKLARRHKSKFTEVSWREGSKGLVSARVLHMRVVTSHRRYRPQSKPMWLIIEWLEGDENPSNYVLSNLPETIPLNTMLNICGNR